MKEFIAAGYAALLKDQQLDDFNALWELDLPTVDLPNTERGGWSSVCRLELNRPHSPSKPLGLYLKRQRNHCSYSWRRPLGEPTFAREFRNICRYYQAGISVPEVVYFAERKGREGRDSILMTRALDQYRPLSEVLSQWPILSQTLRHQILRQLGIVVARLHGSRITHHCLYPKHVFVKLDGEEIEINGLALIDLEKSRFQLLRRRERTADLAALFRRAQHWTESERKLMLTAYLDVLPQSYELSDLLQKIVGRQQSKLNRVA